MLRALTVGGEEYLIAPMKPARYKSDEPLTAYNFYLKEKIQLFTSAKWWDKRLKGEYNTDGTLRYLDLPEGYLNPIYSFTAGAPLPTLLGIDESVLYRLYTFDGCVVKGGGGTAFAEGEVISKKTAKEHPELTLYLEDELIERLLSGISLTKELERLLSLIGSGKYFPRAEREGMRRALDFVRLLLACQIEPRDLFVREIPVLPPFFMPMAVTTLPSGTEFGRGTFQYNILEKLINRILSCDKDPLSEARIGAASYARDKVNNLLFGVSDFRQACELNVGSCYGLYKMLPREMRGSPMWLDLIHSMGMDIYPITDSVSDFLRETELKGTV